MGYGSIGSRHARILKALDCETAVVSARRIDFEPRYSSLSEAIKKAAPQYVVIANKTAEHYPTLCELEKNGFKGVVLVEKPLFSKPEKARKFSFKKMFVAYNLRFHPVIQHLKELLRQERPISAQCYVGQSLYQWRPQSDYRNSYSASKTAGGGALRDLSHELDYLSWLLGPWKKVAALGGHYSSLEITSDDVFCLLMATAKCPAVMVQMNYVDKMTQRELIVNTDKHTFRADLIAGTLQIDKTVEKFKSDRDLTYRLEHQAILKGDYTNLCSFREGTEVADLIASAEKAAQKKKWILR